MRKLAIVASLLAAVGLTSWQRRRSQTGAGTVREATTSGRT